MFGKTALDVRLMGLTDDGYDSGVDTIQHHLLPILKDHFGFDN